MSFWRWQFAGPDCGPLSLPKCPPRADEVTRIEDDLAYLARCGIWAIKIEPNEQFDLETPEGALAAFTDIYHRVTNL